MSLSHRVIEFQNVQHFVNMTLMVDSHHPVPLPISFMYSEDWVHGS